MSTKPNASETKNKKSAVKAGLSTFSKILLSLFLILAIFVAWFAFHAWQVLNTTPETSSYASQTSFEILTPTGAQGTNNSAQQPVFVPNPVITAASDSENISAASTPATTETPNRENIKPKTALPDTQEIQPLIPTNVPVATGKDDDNGSDTHAIPAPAAKPKPAANSANSKPLDNLF